MISTGRLGQTIRWPRDTSRWKYCPTPGEPLETPNRASFISRTRPSPPRALAPPYGRTPPRTARSRPAGSGETLLTPVPKGQITVDLEPSELNSSFDRSTNIAPPMRPLTPEAYRPLLAMPASSVERRRDCCGLVRFILARTTACGPVGSRSRCHQTIWSCAALKILL